MNRDEVKKQFRVEFNDDNKVEVFLDDEKVFEWNEESNFNYPEDLTFVRDLSDIFYDGVLAGIKLAEAAKGKKK